MRKERAKAEFGDFQTPPLLARQVCKLLVSKQFQPASVVEPTCGLGNLFFAALDAFPLATRALAVDVNREYVGVVRGEIARRDGQCGVEAMQGDFFALDWSAKLQDFPEPLLVIGNPPWVTNSELGTLDSENLPHKSNFQNRTGFDALTGKSNFDISEWMLLKIFDWLISKRAVLAMLCKTVVARKVLAQMWQRGASLGETALFRIDAKKHFEAAVDACLLVCDFSNSTARCEANVYETLCDEQPSATFGLCDGQLIANVARYRRRQDLLGESPMKWRSGVKHDCSKVMELRKEGDSFRNGLGEIVSLEERFLYPMLKSSELGGERVNSPTRWMLVTQEAVRDETAPIERIAPLTWKYLESHSALLDARRSSIYCKRARFSMFGVGAYTFAPWKVAISGFYKRLEFRVVGPCYGKPTVLDDTCYFLPFARVEQAELVARLLNSSAAREFFEAFVFWDAKRPITVDLLKQLDLRKVAKEVEAEEEWQEQFPDHRNDGAKQRELFV